MAIANSDGSITLEVKVNKSELENALKEMKSSTKGIGSLNKSISSTTALLGKMATALGVAFGVREIIRFSNEASKAASTMEASMQRIGEIYGEASDSVNDFIDTTAHSIGMAKSAAMSYASVYGNLFSVWADQKTNAELTNQYLNMTAVVASKTGRTVADVQERIRSGLLGNTEAIEDLGVFVNVKTIEMTDAFKRMANGRSWEQLGAYEQNQVRTLAILEQATSKYGNTVANTSVFARSSFTAAYEDFKATWGQVVNLVLIPILQVATQILNTVTAVLQKIFHLTGKQLDTNSKISSSIGSAAENQDKLTDSIKGTNKELKKELASFDELEILSRDTASNTTSGSGGSGGGVSTVGGDVGGGLGGEAIVNQGEIDAKLAAIVGLTGAALVGLGILLLFTGGNKLLALGMIAIGALTVWTAAEMVELTTEEEKKKLEELFAIVGVVAFNLGVLLLFTKKWKWGLGLMGMGVADVVGALAMGDFKGDVKTLVSEILLIAGLVAFMLGVICLFIPKCWKYGIALMASGVSEVIGAVALGGEELKQELKSFCVKYWEAIYLISAIVVVVGVVLLFVNAKKMWKYATTLIIAGIAAIVAETLLGGDELKQELQTFCTKHWKLLYGIGVIMVCLGLVLLFVNAKTTWKIAITLILAGIADLVGTTVLGGDTLKKELQTTCDNYWKEIYAIGVIMVVVGILLCFTEVGLPYGITLIVGGIGAVAGTTYMSYDTIKQEISNKVNDIKTWIKEHDVLCAVLGIILLFVPGMLGVGVGLLALGGKSLSEEKDLSFSSLKEKLTSQLSDVYTAVSGKVKSIKDKIGEITSTSNVSVGVNVSGGGSGGGTRVQSVGQSVSFQVPALARGAVLPGGNAFLAVVNDNPKGQPNIEGPASLIKEMVDKSLDERGITGSQQIIKEEHYNLNQTELMTIMYKLVKGGERLNGTSLVKQGGI